MTMAAAFPHVDFRREVTVGHLLADVDTAAGLAGQGQPSHPSPRGRRALSGSTCSAGDVDWVASDHACCAAEMKSATPPRHLRGQSGFGGAEYLLLGRGLRGPAGAG